MPLTGTHDMTLSDPSGTVLTLIDPLGIFLGVIYGGVSPEGYHRSPY